MQKFTFGENKGEKVRTKQKGTRKGVGDRTGKGKLSSGQAEGTVKVSGMNVTESFLLEETHLGSSNPTQQLT